MSQKKLITFDNLKLFKEKLDVELDKKQDIIEDLATIRSGAALGATAVQPDDLSAVATSGNYDDLSNKPDLTVYATNTALEEGLATKQDLITPESKIDVDSIEGLSNVATSGSYNDLTDLPAEATDEDIDSLFPVEVSSFADITALNNDPTVTTVNVILTDNINAGSSDITFRKNANIDLNGHTMNFDSWGLEVRDGKTLTVGNGTINSAEAPFYAREGATLIINDGTYSATNNYVIGTNGSIGKGNNTVTINGGTFTGTMSAAGQEAGYIACGVYVANNDTVEIKGGTFNVTDGVGVCARSGHTIIDEGVVFNVTGDGKSGYVGDSKIVVPAGKEIVLDLKAKYPGGTPTVDNYTSYEVYTLADE